MAFDNEYPNRKDWRKPYRKGKRSSRSCRNHGSGDWCLGNRMHKHLKRQSLADETILLWLYDEPEEK